MSTYRNTVTGEIRDLQEAQLSAWISAGNPKALLWAPYTPPEVVEEPTVPDSVTNAQFCAALIDAGIWPEQIDAAINTITDATSREKARYWWQRAQNIERKSAYVNMFAPVFSLSPAQVDALFIHAAALST